MAKSKSPKQRSARPAFERRRGGDARAIAELVPDVGRAAFRRYGFVQSAVVTRWHEIVGDRYAAVSLPEAIRFPQGKREGGTLHLMVEGAHATLMQHVVTTILERVNRFFGYGAVGQVRFRQGAIPAPMPREERAAPVRSKDHVLDPRLGDSLNGIADPELARVLQSLAEAVAGAEPEPGVRGIPVRGRIGGGEKKREGSPT